MAYMYSVPTNKKSSKTLPSYPSTLLSRYYNYFTILFEVLIFLVAGPGDIRKKQGSKFFYFNSFSFALLSGKKLKLIISTGFDGAECQPIYGHTNLNIEEKGLFCSSTHLFATTFGPLRIIYQESNIFCKNPACMSTRFCHTILLQYRKETPKLTKQEYLRLSEEIDELNDVEVGGAYVEYEGYVSKLDMKCLNNIYDNKNTTMCPICNRKSNEFKNMDIQFNMEDTDRLRHGVGVLHTKIRTMESLVKVSERIHLQKY